MLRIGDFSKLSHLTVKALRFYEKEGLLVPAATDQNAILIGKAGQLESQRAAIDSCDW